MNSGKFDPYLVKLFESVFKLASTLIGSAPTGSKIV